jgi:hypothetical protein
VTGGPGGGWSRHWLRTVVDDPDVVLHVVLTPVEPVASLTGCGAAARLALFDAVDAVHADYGLGYCGLAWRAWEQPVMVRVLWNGDPPRGKYAMRVV